MNLIKVTRDLEVAVNEWDANVQKIETSKPTADTIEKTKNKL